MGLRCLVFSFVFLWISCSDSTSSANGSRNNAEDDVKFLENVYNTTFPVPNPRSITAASVEGETYLFVADASPSAGGIRVLKVANDGVLESRLPIFQDSTATKGTEEVVAVVIGVKTYLFVTKFLTDQLMVWEVLPGGLLNLIFPSTVSDSDDPAYELEGARGIATAVLGSTTYLFVTGTNDDGVSVFSVQDNGTLNNVFNYAGSGNFALEGAWGITSVELGGSTFLYITGNKDNRVYTLEVENNGELRPIDRIPNPDRGEDPNNYELDGAREITTAVIGNTTYLFVAGFADDGVSVFELGTSGLLSRIANLSDNDNLELAGVSGITTTAVNGQTYAFVTGFTDDGLSVFEMESDGTLSNIANLSDSDNPNYKLDGAEAVTTAVLDNTTYVFVAGFADNGISVFRIIPDE